MTCEFLEWCRTYLIADENVVNSLASQMFRLREASCKAIRACIYKNAGLLLI
ncbi:hypothetical protein [Clostridium aciditolerans]|uniref:Uncharacterized protein n=1 Tax=Clostridium aciditolerans TaxID=339861 RepID=A0A934HZB3_9CLOT|nr:hypothetical protein [Clostridium aciditolerans]MBI6874849.1 hypothetical protein [Clostridium aciditolerans]